MRIRRELMRRAAKRLRRAWLALVGVRIRGTIDVGISTCDVLRPDWPNVAISTLVEDAGLSKMHPRHLPEDDRAEMQPFRITHESVLLDVRAPDFYFANQLLLAPDRRAFFIEDFSAEQVLAFRRFAPRRYRELRGTVAYLSNNWANNYYHWMQLTLPLLRLYRKMVGKDAIDYFYVGEGVSARFQDETLAALGIETRRIVREPCRGDRMVAAYCIHPPQFGLRFRDVWGHEFVQSLFECPPPDRNGSRRIYISRGTARTRGTINEDEIVEYLRPMGFQPLSMDGLTVAKQAKLFAQADVILGTHGAALTNLLFAKPGTKVIEILPPHVHEVSFFAAATHSRLDYTYLVASDAGTDHQIRVEIDKLRRALALAGMT